MAGLDKKAADGLQLRADKLHDHLAHQYRRSCTLSNGCATRCIPYALSGAGAFGCSCTHTHEMSAEEDNERFLPRTHTRACAAYQAQSVYAASCSGHRACGRTSTEEKAQVVS